MPSTLGIVSSHYVELPPPTFTGTTVLRLSGEGPNGGNNNGIRDISNNNFGLTKIGNPTQSSSTPFTLGGNSLLFNGVSWIETATDAIPYASSQWTIECWFNSSDLTSRNGILGRGDLMSLDVDNTRISFAWRTATVDWVGVQVPFAFQTNTWYHIAIVRNGSNFRCFINGNRQTVSQTAYAGAPLYDYPLTIGVTDDYPFGSLNHFFRGLISNFRITSTAVYASSFAVPTSPLASTGATTSFLLSSIPPSIVDSSPNNHSISTIGNAQISTAVKKNGNGSIYFDGTGDYLTVSSPSNFNFGTGDFAIGCWINMPNISIGANGRAIIDTRPNDANGNFWIFGFTSSARLFITVGNTSSPSTNSLVAPVSSLIAPNKWTHVAAIRQSGIVTLYIDGRVQATGNLTGTAGASQMVIGKGAFSGFDSFIGYIDDLIINKP